MGILALCIVCSTVTGLRAPRDIPAAPPTEEAAAPAFGTSALQAFTAKAPVASLSQLSAGDGHGLDRRAQQGLRPFLSLELQRIAWDEAAKLNSDPKNVSMVRASLQERRRIYKNRDAGELRRKRPKAQVTIFKVVFGCCFLASLILTCAARQFLVEKEPETTPLAAGAAQSAAVENPAEPSGAPAPPPTPARNLAFVKASVTVILWMIFSIFFIIFNKHMFTKGGFPYPVTLTAMHMGSCYIVFGFMRMLSQEWRKSAMPDADKHIPLDLYVKGLVPAALLMALGLGIGNLGFLYATVAFIQMVKPINIVVTSIAGFIWGLEPATPTHLCIAVLVSGGVAIAASGEVQFSLGGLVCQLAASVCEGLRLIILQGIMQGSLRLDPLTTLYRFTPVAGLALCVLACVIEGQVIWSGLKMPGVLVLNCVMAVGLNVLIAAVVQQTSAVVFVLAGVTKDIATIAISAVMYNTQITGQEVGGYAISVVGIGLYKVYKDYLPAFKEFGMFRGFWYVLTAPKQNT